MNEKKELQVAALENGTVIDHIPSDKVFTVVSLLDLQNTDGNITIGNNFESKKLGKKFSDIKRYEKKYETVERRSDCRPRKKNPRRSTPSSLPSRTRWGKRET